MTYTWEEFVGKPFLVHSEGKVSAASWALWEEVRRCEFGWPWIQLYVATGVDAKGLLMAVNYHFLHFSLFKIASNPWSRVKGGHRKVDGQASWTHESTLLKSCFREIF